MTAGLWIVEAPELSGLERREVEAVKHQITCQRDRARMAFGRVATTVPRQFVMVATTNSYAYLKDPTGGRRFCPVTVTNIDLEAFRRDRDQLFAEAYSRAVTGEAAGIPRDLWAAAHEVQEARRIMHPIEEDIRDKLAGILCGYIPKDGLRRALGFQSARDISQPNANEITRVMRALGWHPSRQRRPGGGDPVPVYQKLVPGLSPEWLEGNGDSS